MKTVDTQHQKNPRKGQNPPFDCLTAWQNAAPSLMFDIRGTSGEIILSPQIETQLPTNPHFLKGTLDNEPFFLAIDPIFFDALFASIAIDLNVSSMNQADIPLVLEHLFTPYFEVLESTLDCQLSFTNYSDNENLAEQNQFDFTIHSMDTVFEGKLFTDSLNTLNKLTTALLPFQTVGEKNCSIVSDIAIGPIVLEKQDIASLAVGDLVSIGKGADQNLDGYIKRANGTSWKALLGGSSAVVKSEKQAFEKLFKIEENQVLLGLKIGTTNISANKLLTLKQEDELTIDRLAENAVHLVMDNQVLAYGVLQTSGGNLCIAISQLEAPHADD